MPSRAVKSKPKLWEEVYRKWLQGSKAGPAGKWNARKAMLATKEYQNRGGGYVGPKDPKNSLKKWEKEDWGYIDGDEKSRYLPKAVRDQLSKKEKITERRLKNGQKGKIVSYSDSVNTKMRKAGIYKKVAPKKSAAKKSAAKKSAAKKSAPKKSAPKKSTAKKSAPKKAAPKKSTAKKSTPKKSAPKKVVRGAA